LANLLASYFTEKKEIFLQKLAKVKVYRVFSSLIKQTESSPLFQFHKIKRDDSN